MKTTQYLKSSITNGGPLTRVHTAMELVAHMDHYLPWLAAREFSGLSIKKKEAEWMATLKAWSGQKPQVAFFAAETLEELYLAIAWRCFGTCYGGNRTNGGLYVVTKRKDLGKMTAPHEGEGRGS